MGEASRETGREGESMSLPTNLSSEEIVFLEVAAIAFGSTPESVYADMKRQETME